MGCTQILLVENSRLDIVWCALAAGRVVLCNFTVVDIYIEI